jgi:hypothetical protein
MKTFGKKALDFFTNLHPKFPLPDAIDFLLPYKEPEAISIANAFFNKFYNDNHSRIFIIGINPGRFGAGVTGISFTDPIRLEKECGIENDFQKKPELSSVFIYEMIHAMGGVKSFYGNFFLTAVCPVGFIKGNKNLNYYDDKMLLDSSNRFIQKTLTDQLDFGAVRQTAICLGEGKNYSFLLKMNEKLRLFEEIIPLAHPRFIMQYRRKKMNEYINLYVEKLTTALLKKQE